MTLTDSQKWLVLALVIAGGVLLYLLAPVLTPFVVSALLAYLGDPLVDRLERYRLSRTVSVVIVFITMFFAGLLGLRVGSIKGHQGGHKQISGAMHNGLMALMLGGSAKVCPMANRHTQSQAGVQPSSGSNQAAEAAHPRDAVDLLPRSRRAFPARRLAR
jgi:predicted PurR-regulated permease PerM